MSGFMKRMVLSMVASKLQRMSQKRHNPAVDGLLREVNHRIARSHGYHHPGPHGHAPYGHAPYGHHGHYRHRGHYRHHGHYRRRWF